MDEHAPAVQELECDAYEHERHDHHHGWGDHRAQIRRYERHQVPFAAAGEEVEIAWQNDLISEHAFDHGRHRIHRERCRRGRPEPVDEREQHNVDHHDDDEIHPPLVRGEPGVGRIENLRDKRPMAGIIPVVGIHAPQRHVIGPYAGEHEHHHVGAI